MSVAFRRESDEEHLEPRFELPIPAGPNLVTARGLAMIVARIDALEAGLKDADAEEAKAIGRDLRYWRTRRATAVETAARADGVAGFGSCVRFAMGGRERSVTIVGDDEAEPRDGLLSFSAPLARALMGTEAGDLVDFGGRETAIEILDVT